MRSDQSLSASPRDTVGEFDTQIAAHALAEELILVTHNTDHFERIPGLKLEDWMV
jgi:tRNA(fMet)-specific endonuclease VapC